MRDSRGSGNNHGSKSRLVHHSDEGLRSGSTEGGPWFRKPVNSDEIEVGGLGEKEAKIR